MRNFLSNRVYLYLHITYKLLGRRPEKIFIFVRDISIPLILLLSVSAIIASFSNNIILLNSLAGGETFLSLRADSQNLEEGFIPSGIEIKLEDKFNNKIDILANNQAVVHFKVQNDLTNSNISTESVFLGTDLLKIGKFWDQDSESYNSLNISGMANQDIIVGQELANTLDITQNDLPLDAFVSLINNSEKFIHLHVVGILEGFPQFRYNILADKNIFSLLNSKYTTNINYILIKLNNIDNVDEFKQEISTFIISELPEYKLVIDFARGSQTILDDILFEIVDKLQLFNMILIVLVFIRLFQAEKWIMVHFEEDFVYLRIVGKEKLDIFLISLLMGHLIGLFALILVFPVSIILPHGITLFLTLFFGQVFIPEIPELFSLITSLFILNAVFIGSGLIPSLQAANLSINKKNN